MPVFALASTTLAFALAFAHFMRGGQYLLAGFCVVGLGLVWVRERWVPWVLQLMLALAALEWVRTIASIAAARIAEGRPATRMAIILGSVVAVTVLAAVAQGRARARDWYASDGGTAAREGAIGRRSA